LLPRVFINISTHPLQSVDVFLGTTFTTQAINGKIKCHYHVLFTLSLIRSIFSIESSFPNNELPTPTAYQLYVYTKNPTTDDTGIVILEHIASEYCVFPIIPSYGSLVCPGIALEE